MCTETICRYRNNPILSSFWANDIWEKIKFIGEEESTWKEFLFVSGRREKKKKIGKVLLL